MWRSKKSLHAYSSTNVNVRIKSTTENAKLSELQNYVGYVTTVAKALVVRETNLKGFSKIVLLGDDTGVVRTLVTDDFNGEGPVEGRMYRIQNAFSGAIGLILNNKTSLKDYGSCRINVPCKYLEGKVVSVNKGSGLVAKCPICGRRLARVTCCVHGTVSPVYELSINISVANDKGIHPIVLDGVAAETVTEMNHEEAVKLWKTSTREFLEIIKRRVLDKRISLKVYRQAHRTEVIHAFTLPILLEVKGQQELSANSGFK